MTAVVDVVGSESIAADEFRSAFRRHPAGIVVVTADAGDGPVGFTATSFTSVSLHPPLASFVVARDASSWPGIARAGTVVVHMLAARQHQLATTFATSGIDRFATPTRWSRLPTGEPTLDDAPTVLRCHVEQRIPAGDHHIVVIRVAGVQLRRDHDPLLWFGGRYHGLVDEAVPASSR